MRTLISLYIIFPSHFCSLDFSFSLPAIHWGAQRTLSDMLGVHWTSVSKQRVNIRRSAVFNLYTNCKQKNKPIFRIKRHQQLSTATVKLKQSYAYKKKTSVLNIHQISNLQVGLFLMTHWTTLGQDPITHNTK